MNTKPIVLLPYPLDPRAALAYHVCLRAGLISEETLPMTHYHVGSPYVTNLLGQGEILCLHTALAQEVALAMLDIYKPGASGAKGEKYLRLLCASPPPVNKLKRLYNYATLASGLANTAIPLIERLRWANRYFNQVVEHGLDPSEDLIVEHQVLPPGPGSGLCLPAGNLCFPTPVLEGNATDGTGAPIGGRVIRHREHALPERRIASLVGRHINLIVGGPPNSGKSTFTATLVNIIEHMITSLRSRAGWEEFNLKIGRCTLDAGTPAMEAIAQHNANREAQAGAKQAWSPALAVEAARVLYQVTSQANLTFADLPGKIDGLTEILAVGGDFGCVITRDWRATMQDWSGLFGRTGITKIAQARSWPPRDERFSTVAHYTPGKLVAGRITPLDRMISSDTFIEQLAKLLLFEVLPNLVEKREAASRKVVERWRVEAKGALRAL